MSFKIAAILTVAGLLLICGSILYGRSSPTAAAAEKTQARIETATSRHAHVVAATQAQARKKGEDKAIEALHEIRKKSEQLTAEREKAVARQAFITSALRYSGCIFMLAGALTVLAKTQS
jgi:uncharacterized Zn finger protein (UPF0148 family)